MLITNICIKIAFELYLANFQALIVLVKRCVSIVKMTRFTEMAIAIEIIEGFKNFKNQKNSPNLI